MKLLLVWCTTAIAIASTAPALPGIDVSSDARSWLWLAPALALVDALLGAFARTSPIRLSIVCIAGVGINSGVLVGADAVLDSLRVAGWTSALVGSALLSTLVGAWLLLCTIVGSDGPRIRLVVRAER